jgi:transcriptional regulator with XRE-family HTH domain
MFWETFEELCKRNNTRPNPVAAQLGISSGAVTKWKQKGVIPNGSTLQAIADRFNVTVDYLIGNTDTTSPKRKKAVAISDELWEALQNNPDVLAACEEIARNPEMLQVFKAIKERKDSETK